MHDLRFAIRSLGRSPGFTIVIVLTLALGIGANTAIFSFFRGILLRPLPYEEPERVVAFKKSAQDFSDPVGVEVGFFAADFRELRTQTKTLAEMATYTLDSATLSGRGTSDLLVAAIVKPNFFSLLGSQAALGRTCTATDTTNASGRLAVVAHSDWQARFGSDPELVGKTITLNNVAFTVVGIMPPEFEFPREAHLWVTPERDVPESVIGQPNLEFAGRGNYLRTILGRLAPGVSLEQARLELATLAERLPNPNQVGHAVHLVNMRDQTVGNVRPALAMVLGCVGLVLLIACLNVANLMLSRATAREREIGIRLALGAGRGRIARQLLTESTLLAVLGGAGLLIRSFTSVLQVNLGFQPEHAVSWRLAASRNFANAAERHTYFDGLVTRVAALPGVTAVGLTDCLPLSRNRTWGAGVRDVQYGPGEYPIAFPRMVDRQYLRAMNIPLRQGRFFDERDAADAPRTIIINENLARHIAPDGDALGLVLNVNDGSTVIGVVGNVRHSSLEETAGFEMYLDYHQISDWGALDLVVRSARPIEPLVPEVRTALAAHDPSLPGGEFQPLGALVDNAVAPRRLITQLLGVFSAFALTLAALGLYGVIAYSVTQRTQEIGIRMAIGAQRRDILRLILRGGLGLVALGVAVGLAGSLALTRLLQSLLFGVSAYDPLVFAANAALLLAVAAIACLLPALRATRVDPLVALRAE